MTLIGLEYLKHKENVRSNQAKEKNTVFDIETRANTADKDRAMKVSEGSLDRQSKERIASADRTSKEGIAQADRDLKSSEAALDREMKVSENALDRKHDIQKARAKNYSDAGFMAAAEEVLQPGSVTPGQQFVTDTGNRFYNDLLLPAFGALVGNAAKNLAPKSQYYSNNYTGTWNNNYGSVMNQKFYP